MSLVRAALFGFLLILPFLALEYINRGYDGGFPFAVHFFTWILSTLFVLILMSIVKDMRSGKPFTKKPLIFSLRVAGLLLIAYIWGGWILDQWPCFMGVPNCD